MSKVRIGIIGPGTITPRFINGARMVKDCEVYAVGSRDRARAREFAVEYEIPYHGTYEDLIADENVDAIYLATPNHTHYEIAKKCLENGKHVLCEKPMFETAAQTEELFKLAYSKKVILMEAMKALFLPLTAKIKRIIESGEIGEVRYMDGKFAYQSNVKQDHWAYDPNNGGGMRDVGVYPLGYFNYLANSPIKDIKCISRFAENGADEFTHALVEYKNGIISSSFGGLALLTETKAMIYGTKGHIEIYNFWKASEARLVKGDYHSTIRAEMDSDFKYETEHFVKCIINGYKESPVIGLRECLDLIKVYDARKKTK